MDRCWFCGENAIQTDGSRVEVLNVRPHKVFFLAIQLLRVSVPLSVF